MTFGVAHHPSFIDTIRRTIAESYKDKIFHFTNTMTIQISETNQGNDKKSSSKASKTLNISNSSFNTITNQITAANLWQLPSRIKQKLASEMYLCLAIKYFN